MPGKPRILIVDDDTTILNLLELSLRKDGFEVLKATSGLTGLKIAYDAHPDAIVLDVMMPGMDGLEVCRRLREMTDASILVLSAKGQTEDIVRALQVGADDYMVKPYVYAEVFARLTACLRRRASSQPPEVVQTSDETLWLTDPPRHLVFVDGRAVKLTPKEFGVLQYLARHSGRVLSADAILANVWGPEYVGEHCLLKQFIYRLRTKLETDPRQPRHILTVRGSGYVLETTP